MRQPDKYIDNKTIALLTEHPGWKHLKNLFMDRLDAEMESIVRAPLHDTESQAWEEILKYPEQAANKPTSTG